MALKLSNTQRDEVSKIIELGNALGGSEDIDNYLMEKLFAVLLPEDSGEDTKMNDLATLYGATEDPDYAAQLKDEYYKSQGIDPAQKAKEDALLEQFAGEYENNPNSRYYEAIAQQNPGLLEQYYNEAPQSTTFGERYKQGVESTYDDFGGILGNILGASLPGKISGLISGFKGGESANEKEKRLKSLIEQYKSSLPNN